MSNPKEPNQTEFRKIPAVDKWLDDMDIQGLVNQFSHEMVVFVIQNVSDDIRQKIKNGDKCPSIEYIKIQIFKQVNLLTQANLKRVINASGVVIHTNLGRAPFGEKLIHDAMQNIVRYNNLEFDLEAGDRGKRDSHISPILKYLTGAEDVVVVNNNAAAVMLILRTLAKGKEVIVSRGELIEIGGAFRVPDIMKASDCTMVEVGTTNKTKPSDYKEAITENTKILLKTHKSNYSITGFTREVSLEELKELGEKHHVPVVFDIGSGLLRKVSHPALADEPDVRQALKSGADLVCFSGDKLLGGPQAGIIAGRKDLIAKIKKEPMMRALRVGKSTLTLLETAARFYLNDERLKTNNVFFNTILQTDSELKTKAKYLQGKLKKLGIETTIEKDFGRFGGGTLPDKTIDTYVLKFNIEGNNQTKSAESERIYRNLLLHSTPVLSILKGAQLYVDVLTLTKEEMDIAVQAIAKVVLKDSE